MISSLAFGLGQALFAFGQSPPVVGRPVDFSGAVGGPFVVQWIAAPNELIAEEPLTLTLRITGAGNLKVLHRPDLGALASFKQFAVENLDDSYLPGDPPRREFRYRVRPRSAHVIEVPRFKLVYFNPRIIPPSRGFQTTYADAMPLAVKPRTTAIPTNVPLDVPDWMLAPPSSDELIGPPPHLWQRWLEIVGLETATIPRGGEWLFVVAILLAPPALCAAWLVIWRHWTPNAARLAASRRSRAATVALRSLRRAGRERAELVAVTLIGYLRDKTGMSSTATTPAEISANLTVLGCPAPLTGNTVSLFHRCDASRFSPISADDTLVENAVKLIMDWEAAPCSGPAC